MAVKGDTIDDLPRVEGAAELTGALLEVEVLSGPANSRVNKGATTEQLAEAIGAGAANRGPNPTPSAAYKQVIFLTQAEAIAAGRPNCASLDQLDPLTMCTGTVVRVDLFPGNPGQELILCYDPAGTIRTFIDGNLTRYYDLSLDGLNPNTWYKKGSTDAILAGIRRYSSTYNKWGKDETMKIDFNGTDYFFSAVAGGGPFAAPTAPGDPTADWKPASEPTVPGNGPDLTPRVTQLEADTLALRTPGPNAATLYVQGDGSTLTAQRGNPYRPYPSLPAAHAAAQSGDTILVRPGGTGRDEAGRAYYAEEYVQTKNVFVTFEPGAIYGGLFWLGATNGPGFNYRVVGGEFRERILLRRQQVASTGLVENARFTGPMGGVQYASSGGTPTGHTDTLTLRNCVIAGEARANAGLGFGYDANGPVRNNGFVGGGPGDIILDNTLVISANTACLTDSAAAGHVILRGTTELRPGPGQSETSALQAPGMPGPRPASEWLVDERRSTGGPALDSRDPYDVPAAKRKAVVDAGLPTVVELDTAYYGCEFVDEVYGPSQPAYYKCIPSAPASTGGATTWKWFRFDIL